MKRLFLFISAVLSAMTLYSELYFNTGFESLETDKPLTRSLWVSEGFNDGGWEQGFATRSSVDVEHSSEGAKSMRIMYPGGGLAGASNTGVQIPLTFEDKSAEEMYVSYSMRPSENFTWGTTSFGGKLPGLGSGTSCTGDKVCDGTNGFSSRYMWRDGGRLVVLLYHMDYTKIYGEDIDLTYPNGKAVVAEPGKWIHLTQRVKMNTVTVENGVATANADGILQVWANGVLVLDRQDIRLRTNDALVDNFYISTFHGGGDATWAPTEDCYIWFDDIRIGTTYDDVKFKDCSGIDLGDNKNLCSSKEATFALKSVSDNLSYSWFKNRLPIAETSSITVSDTGAYVLIVDSLGCSRRDTVLLTNSLVSVLPESLRICERSFVSLDPKVSEDAQFEWSKNGEIIANTSKLVVKSEGEYEVKITAPNCGSITDIVMVESGLLKVDDISGPKGEKVVLEIESEKENLGWYDSEQCENLLANGRAYETVIPSSPSYLYVKDLDGFSGLVGKKGITGKTYTYSNSSMDNAMTDSWMVFTVQKSLTIDSVSLYPHTLPCSVVVKILNNETSEEVYYNTFDLPRSGENRVALNAELEPGVYRFDMLGSTGILKQSYGDADITFPYVIDGLISIDGANKSWMNKVGGRYLAVYDWRVSTGNHCAATPVLLSPSNETNNEDMEQMDIVVFPTHVENDIYIEGLSGESKVTIFNALGAKMMYKQTKSDKLHLSIAQWVAGEYIVQIENGADVRIVKVVKK